MRIQLPNLLGVDLSDSQGTIQQISKLHHWIDGDLANYESRTLKAKVIVPVEGERILVVTNSKKTDAFARVLLVSRDQDLNPIDNTIDLSHGSWFRHPNIPAAADLAVEQTSVLESWSDAFAFIKEDNERQVSGLREPQYGAIHAINAHWAVTDEPATVVMPTGTGKTETMLSILVLNQCRKLLIVVPTDALRNQIANKFLTLGVLKEFGVVAESAHFPIVGILKHKPRSEEDVDDFFTKCNVIVTTSHIAGQSEEAIQSRIAEACSDLFIDEAHHVSANTWKNFKEHFAGKRILQFTATPFREDDKPVEGKIIFKYPLPRAQEKGYFTRINFKGVRAFAKKQRDEAIAEAAVEQLREDLKTYRHILMARVNTIERAKEVFEIYTANYAEFNPVQIHTGITSKSQRDAIKAKLFSGESKIVVCVDMLGEGFDLPELKIAAFHDIRQSPTVTIQLAGRFTRPRTDLGAATFVANTGAKEVRDELKKLYTQDPDWNFLLPQLSEELIQEQIDLTAFAEGFNDFPKDVPIQTLTPALSTVIYKTDCQDWNPTNYKSGIPGIASFERNIHAINKDSHTLIVITARKTPLPWTQLDKMFSWEWSLYVIYWDKEQNLLFINNSSNSGDFKRLAQAVAGDTAKLIKGNQIFRAFGNVYRIVFNNVGLNEHLGKLVSYTGRMGSNVEPVLTDRQRQRASKSVLFGTGFTNGQRTSIGCSSKGRVWSHGRAFQINKLIQWCSFIGSKVLDETIDPDDYLKNTLVPEDVSEVPAKMPFAIDWNREIYKTSEDALSFVFDDGAEVFLFEVDIKLVDPAIGTNPVFQIETETKSERFTLSIEQANGQNELRISNDRGTATTVKFGGNTCPIEEFFSAFPPVIWFTDGSELCGTTFTPLRKSLPPYSVDKILPWDWTGTNIRTESQGVAKTPGTIQHSVIQKLIAKDFDIVFDDDSSGEAADIVAIKVADSADHQKIIKVELYHCKFSTDDNPGARVSELYEVCGQTQRSVRWMDDPSELFTHLLRREEKRVSGRGVSRIDKGDTDKLHEILEMSRLYKTEMSIFAVQPGLSKAQIGASQLELLGVTETYLTETYLIPFTVISSP
ncbi:MAG: DEAD/DEAH box helicase family protein [Pyrinomonadaceae bacterium]